MKPRHLFVNIVFCLALPSGLNAQTPGSTVAEAQIAEALREEILAMAEEDQQVRQVALTAMSREMKAEMERVDLAHEKRMRDIVARHGWPGASLVGAEAAARAWLIVQHCSAAFQEECLPLLERAVTRGEALPKNYAYLLDRVRMAQGKPQVYGTQFINDKPWKIENPESIDERRRSVGLEPLADYAAQMSRAYQRFLEAQAAGAPAK